MHRTLFEAPKKTLKVTLAFKISLSLARHNAEVKISAPSFAVSGFFDGKAHSIQSQVLAGVDRLERASRTNQGDLVVRVDGRRSPPALEFAKTAAFVATGAAAGYTLANLIAQNDMIAAIPQSIASHYEEHGMLAVIPYAFTHTLTPWGSLVRGGRGGNPITRDFLRLLHGETPAA